MVNVVHRGVLSILVVLTGCTHADWWANADLGGSNIVPSRHTGFVGGPPVDVVITTAQSDGTPIPGVTVNVAAQLCTVTQPTRPTDTGGHVTAQVTCSVEGPRIVSAVLLYDTFTLPLPSSAIINFAAAGSPTTGGTTTGGSTTGSPTTGGTTTGSSTTTEGSTTGASPATGSTTTGGTTTGGTTTGSTTTGSTTTGSTTTGSTTTGSTTTGSTTTGSTTTGGTTTSSTTTGGTTTDGTTTSSTTTGGTTTGGTTTSSTTTSGTTTGGTTTGGTTTGSASHTCAPFGGPLPAAQNSSFFTGAPHALAVDAAGHPVVAYTISPGAGQAVYVNVWTGGAWAQLASSATGAGVSGAGNNFAPGLALDASGYPHIGWVSAIPTFVGYVWSVHYQRWTGSAWQGLNGNVANGYWSGSPGSSSVSIALDDTATPFVGTSQPASDVELHTPEGSVWSGPSDPNTSPHVSLSGSQPDVLVDALGNPLIVWTTPANQIFLARWNGTSWAALGDSLSTGINAATAAVAFPTMVMQPDGNPVVAWEDGASGTTQIYARRFDGVSWVDMGGSSSGLGVSRSSQGAHHASLTLGSAGQVAAAWEEAGSGTVYLRQFDGSAWNEVQGSASGPGVASGAPLQAWPHLAYDPSVGYVVAYMSPGELNVCAW